MSSLSRVLIRRRRLGIDLRAPIDDDEEILTGTDASTLSKRGATSLPQIEVWRQPTARRVVRSRCGLAEIIMNRRILIQATAPAVLIGLLLFAVCLTSAWYLNRLQSNRVRILSSNVASLRAALELEISLRKLRFLHFLYLVDPDPEHRDEISREEKAFVVWLERAKNVANTDEEWDHIQSLESNYQAYLHEFALERAEIEGGLSPRVVRKLAERHPVRHMVEDCEGLFRVNEAMIADTSRESDRLSQQLRTTLLLLGLGGPLSGVILGYGVARGLSQSLYRLSVRVQDITQHLDHDVASVSVRADGDLEKVDRQLQHVVHRVQEATERWQMQQRELLRTEQLAAVGQMAAGVAHEIRNPLTAIKLLVEAAMRPTKPRALREADLKVIHHEITRLEETVQGLLDYARPPRAQRQLCDLREVVHQACDLARARAKQQGVELVVEAGPKPIPADVDHNQVNGVVVNLLFNALDAMPKGGRLEVELQAQNRRAILRVRDTGAGIAPDMVGKLFVPFASSKATGTGLGLSISRRVVEEHGGRISAANRPEGGACFTVVLPMAAEAIPEPEPTPAAAVH